MLNIRHFQFFDLVTAFDYSTILQLRLHHRPTWSGCSPSVDGWLLAAGTDSKNLEMRVFLKLNKDLM